MLKQKIDKKQQKSKCMLYEERDEMINHIIYETQNYDTRHWEWWKKVEFLPYFQIVYAQL